MLFLVKSDPLTPCCDFRLDFFDMIFSRKHPKNGVLFGVLTSKLKKNKLTTLKLTKYAKIVDFTLFSIVFYRKMPNLDKRRYPGNLARVPILVMTFFLSSMHGGVTTKKSRMVPEPKSAKLNCNNLNFVDKTE